MASTVVSGRMEIWVGDQLMFSKKGATLMLGGVERTPVEEDTYHGYTEEYKAARLTFSVTDVDQESVDPVVLAAVTSATVLFRSAATTGPKVTYRLDNAVCKGNPTLTAGTSSLEFEFFAEKTVRLLS